MSAVQSKILDLEIIFSDRNSTDKQIRSTAKNLGDLLLSLDQFEMQSHFYQEGCDRLGQAYLYLDQDTANFETSISWFKREIGARQDVRNVRGIPWDREPEKLLLYLLFAKMNKFYVQNTLPPQVEKSLDYYFNVVLNHISQFDEEIFQNNAYEGFKKKNEWLNGTLWSTTEWAGNKGNDQIQKIVKKGWRF